MTGVQIVFETVNKCKSGDVVKSLSACTLQTNSLKLIA